MSTEKYNVNNQGRSVLWTGKRKENENKEKAGKRIILRLPSQGQNIPDFFSKSEVASNHGAVKQMPESYLSFSPAPRSE